MPVEEVSPASISNICATVLPVGSFGIGSVAGSLLRMASVESEKISMALPLKIPSMLPSDISSVNFSNMLAELPLDFLPISFTTAATAVIAAR